MEWLREGDRLFQNDNSTSSLNACLGYAPVSLASVAEKYKEAADALATLAVKGNVFLDRAILPIIFLYRQHLELLVKDIIYTVRRICDEGNNYPQHHNLKNLWAEAMRLLKKHYGKEVPKELNYMQRIIDDIHTRDPRAIYFRYPPEKDDYWKIDLHNFCEVMSRVDSLLGCIASDLSQKLDSMCEM